MNKNDEPIIIEQSFKASIDTVWTSITDINQMREWYFKNIPSFEPEVGFETQFNVQSQDRNFLHQWKVTDVNPLKMITYNWKYENYPGDSFVVFELFKQDSSTMLRLTHQFTESFPEDVPEFLRESGVQGWRYFINKSLKNYLDSL